MGCLGTSDTARVRSRLRAQWKEFFPLCEHPECRCMRTHCGVLAEPGARGHPGQQPCCRATAALVELWGGGPQRVGLWGTGVPPPPRDQQDRATSAPGRGNRGRPPKLSVEGPEPAPQRPPREAQRGVTGGCAQGGDRQLTDLAPEHT